MLCRGFVYWLQAGQPVFQKYLYLGQYLMESGPRPFYSSPIYTLWMYMLSDQAGCTPDLLRLLQLVAGLLTVVLVTRTTHLLTHRTAAVAAGLLYGLTGPVLVYESDLVTASLVVLAQAAALYFLVMGFKTEEFRYMTLFPAGLCTGLAMGLRPNVMLAIPVLVIALMDRRKSLSNNVARIGCFLAGIVLVVAPITLTNVIKTGEFIPVTASGGSVFYSSNNFRATGLGYSPPSALTEIESQWMGQHRSDQPVEHDIFKFLAERAAGRDLTHGETSQFYKQEGWRSLLSDPAKAVRFWFRKLFYAVNNYEVLDTASLLSASQRIGQALPFLLPGGVLIVLGLFGLRYISINDRTVWIILAFMMTHVVTAVAFYVNGRLRAPLFYFLALLAGPGLIRLIRMIREKDPAVWMSLLAIMGLAALTGYQDQGIIRHSQIESPSFFASVKAMAARKSGNMDEARRLYQRAIESNPLGAVEAWQALSEFSKLQGNESAEQFYSQKVQGLWDIDSIDEMSRDNRLSGYELLMTRARSEWMSGSRSVAMMSFKEAVQRFPEYPDPWFNCAVILSQTNQDWDRVVDYVDRALENGMKLSLESTRAHKLRLKGFELLGDSDRLEKTRAQIRWESSRQFNPVH